MLFVMFVFSVFICVCDQILMICSFLIDFVTGKSWRADLFLGRLPKVDLIILEGEKMSVRTSVRPSTKSFFDLNEIWYVGRGR